MLEYNFRGIPHTEIKIEGGTADHTHYELMGFDITKTTGRYLGFGASFTSKNYFKPVTSYHILHGFIASFATGFGTLNFAGEKEFKGGYYPNFVGRHVEENVEYMVLVASGEGFLRRND